MKLKLGEKQRLTVVKAVDFGVYLAPSKDEVDERVLLPKKEVPAGTKAGDEMEVFLYKDSADRLIATTRTPKLTLGQVAVLTVAQAASIGAFLDWGLEKDLLLPYREQTKRLHAGEEVLVSLYIDKSERLAATMKVYEKLRTDSPYTVEDRVKGRIYEISPNFGAFVAVDDCFSALIPKKELYAGADSLMVGQMVEGRVVKALEDGKLTLSVREKAYLQMGKDAQALEALIEEKGGRLPFTDKADPEVIREATGMSKNEFKRAVGHLYKERKIVIEKDCIRKA